MIACNLTLVCRKLNRASKKAAWECWESLLISKTDHQSVRVIDDQFLIGDFLREHAGKPAIDDQCYNLLKD